MKHLTDLKAILHSKRANIYYLEYCRILQKDGRVLYLTEEKKQKLYYNIPIANTTCLLLGTGTSITQAAVRMLCSAGVLIGFCGGGGTPLLMATEVEWLSPQSEYRPTEYLQGWLGFWFDEKKRLLIAKRFQESRINFLLKTWTKDRDLNNEGFNSKDTFLSELFGEAIYKIQNAQSIGNLFQIEADITKKLYKFASTQTRIQDFTRNRESQDKANIFLNHGNYLAYGLAATALWVLGIPHGFAVMHGKTRRGALVFDVADLIKDSVILPWAFICAKENTTEQEFRQQCLLAFTTHKVLDFMFNEIKQASLFFNDNSIEKNFMMVVFVSQCEKKALKRTRRVLDAFADRIGNRTWQTIITEEGLQAVRKLLLKTVTKNSAISCHWIRSRSRSDLLWIVGSKQKFNNQGIVPVNYTEKEINSYKDRELWQSIKLISSAVALAGLFHDIGKTNILFQKKLKGESTKSFEPLRHEWVSLRMFEALVKNKSDEEWLNSLLEITKDKKINILKDGLDEKTEEEPNPLIELPAFAQFIGWLIITHHKLPMKPSWKKGITTEEIPKNQQIDLKKAWFSFGFEAIWNSYNFKDEDSGKKLEENWSFSEDSLPFVSAKWRLRAMQAAENALKAIKTNNTKNIIFEQIFTSHIARLSLMLADHHFSAQKEIEEKWRSPNYSVFANTNEKKELKQQLDEHLIGVSFNAKKIIKALPFFKSSLNHLSENKFLENEKIKNEKFAWQVTAYKEVIKIKDSCKKQGFLGINMASTGMGKTIANAKIIYALKDKEMGSRFTVALGLRTLTLQTGNEYRNQLKLKENQLAIVVGGIATTQLYENTQKQNEENNLSNTGSESSLDYLDTDLFIDYEGSFAQHSLFEWTKNKEVVEKLIQPPVLVCTIDHLIPATDGTKGGRQIAPMLRLLTSDLIIDEPDDFCLDDYPALCRLVYWAGMLGSRVILSTATMPPALAKATFEAYYSGWNEFAKANITNWNGKINCAWFDERKLGTSKAEINNTEEFTTIHEKYVSTRIKYLKDKVKPKHKGKIIEIVKNEDTKYLYKTFAKTIFNGALELHKNHNLTIENKFVSIGLARMANINPMISVAKELLQLDIPENTRVHLCVYHSRYPLAIRSHLENLLDAILKRKKNWPPQEFKNKLGQFKEKNQIFIVLTSPVAEVGRDHDYDWAIIEPSSIRSIIQTSGRVLRHRENIPEKENVYLLNQNIKHLRGNEICFAKPGFENKNLKMINHHLKNILNNEQFSMINSTERIKKTNENYNENLVALEHEALDKKLFTNENSTALWWKESVQWCGSLQKLQPFRKSQKEESFILLLENNNLKWKWKNENVYPSKLGEISGSGFIIKEDNEIVTSEKINFWFDLDPECIYNKLANEFNIREEEASKKFGELKLTQYNINDEIEFFYNKNLGVYNE